MTTFKNRSLAGTGALVATLITVAAATPVRAETVSVPVAYADLDLSTHAGTVALKRRVRHAADQVCGVAATSDRLRSAACRAHAIASADVQIAAIRQSYQLAAR